jgi:hypothetical protein
MDNNIGIILQGPINHYEQVIQHYKNYDNVVFSTWEEAENNSDFLKSIGQTKLGLIFSKNPQSAGPLNVFKQAVSSLNGCLFFKEQKDIKYVWKIRSDMLLEITEKTQQDILDGMVKECKKIAFRAFVDFDQHNYVLDFDGFGQIDEMIRWYDVGSNDYGLTVPEKIFMKNYFQEQTRFDSSFMREKIYYYNNHFIENNCFAKWLKHNTDFRDLKGDPSRFFF